MDSSDAVFAGSVPERYEHDMVPMLFAPFAVDIADRVAAFAPSNVLETAAGTGAVTRQLARVLPAATRLVATDLNEGMLVRARIIPLARPVEWLVADAQSLPFEAESFDVVVCQFGAMFFPDRVGAFAEAHRVLVPGGRFVFSVWDSILRNDFAATVTAAIAALMSSSRPSFIERTPHGYFDTGKIRADLDSAGFGIDVSIVTEARRSVAPDAATAARSFVEGTPLGGEIEDRKPAARAEATAVAARAFAAQYGEGAIEGSMQAHIVTATKS